MLCEVEWVEGDLVNPKKASVFNFPHLALTEQNFALNRALSAI